LVEYDKNGAAADFEAAKSYGQTLNIACGADW
jgi:hypothetical protein